MPTFMDDRGRITRQYDSPIPQGMDDQQQLKRAIVLKLIERMIAGNAGKDAAELDLMRSQAERNRADAERSRQPEPSKFQEAKALQAEMRADPEGAREELRDEDKHATRVRRAQQYAASLQPGYDMAKVGPQLEKMISEEVGPLAAAGDDATAPFKKAMEDAFWAEYDKRGLYEQRGGRGNKLTLQSSWTNPHGGEWLTPEEHAARNPVRAANFGRPFGGG